jgi:hypothetical protein
LKLQWNFANKKKTVSKISSVSQSFKIPKHPNKQTKRKPTTKHVIQFLHHHHHQIQKPRQKCKTKTHQDLQPKNNQTKHEFFAILVIVVM